MSYEGFEQFLCPVGHAWEVDSSVFSYGTNKERTARLQCPKCARPYGFTADVDETNGFDKNVPITYRAPVRIKGTVDEWHTDHHGNRYATFITLYEPPKKKSRWKPNEALKEEERSIPHPPVPAPEPKPCAVCANAKR